MIELLTIGEVLWDLFPDGKRLGGAPYNVAYHARQLGIESAAASRVGVDDLGDEIVRETRTLGLPLDLLQVDSKLPTGTVKVELDSEGKPSFTIAERVAWDAIDFNKPLQNSLPGVKAIAFGTLAQRGLKSRATIREVLKRSPAPYKLYDVNLRPPFYSVDTIRHSLEAATIVKLNDTELQTLQGLFDLPADEAGACREICRAHKVEIVCVTKGPRGASVYDGGAEFHTPGREVKVADTVGAGDAFAAGFLAKLLRGASAQEATEFANKLGAFIATKPGATPRFSPDEIDR